MHLWTAPTAVLQQSVAGHDLGWKNGGVSYKSHLSKVPTGIGSRAYAATISPTKANFIFIFYLFTKLINY